jgi:hypothetical protein
MIHGWQDQGQDLVSRCPVSKLNNETRRIINSSRISDTLEAQIYSMRNGNMRALEFLPRSAVPTLNWSVFSSVISYHRFTEARFSRLVKSIRSCGTLSPTASEASRRKNRLLNHHKTNTKKGPSILIRECLIQLIFYFNEPPKSYLLSPNHTQTQNATFHAMQMPPFMQLKSSRVQKAPPLKVQCNSPPKMKTRR